MSSNCEKEFRDLELIINYIDKMGSNIMLIDLLRWSVTEGVFDTLCKCQDYILRLYCDKRDDLHSTIYSLMCGILHLINPSDLDFVHDLEELSHHLTPEEHAMFSCECISHIQK